MQLSGIQHFAFCRRQWALIHIENMWAENYRTTDGAILHEKAHDPQGSESRGDLLILRGIHIHSARLGITGQCDVVEFHRSQDGIRLNGREGLWKPFPVEYKRGEYLRQFAALCTGHVPGGNVMLPHPTGCSVLWTAPPQTAGRIYRGSQAAGRRHGQRNASGLSPRLHA